MSTTKLEKKKELLKLIATGKEKGFLTYEEINDALPEEVTESDELDEVKRVVKQEMENAAQLSVPLVVDLGTGLNWLESK